MRYTQNQKSQTHTDTAIPDTPGDDNPFAVACMLGRKGRYDEATKALQAALDAGCCSEAEAFDIQARMYAQQGLYLYAETCWQRAKKSDPHNPAYDLALARLRSPQSRGSAWISLVGSCLLLILLGLLTWQIIQMNLYTLRRVQAVEQNTVEIHKEILTMRQAQQTGAQQLDEQIAGINSTLSQLDTRMTQQVAALSAEQNQSPSRQAIIQHIDRQITEMKTALQQSWTTLESYAVKSDSQETRRFTDMEGELTDLARLVNRMQQDLTQWVSQGGLSFTDQIRQTHDALRRELQNLPSAEQMAAVQQTIKKMQDQLEEMKQSLQPVEQEQTEPAPPDQSLGPNELENQ